MQLLQSNAGGVRAVRRDLAQGVHERFLAEFTIERMVDRYLAVFARALDGQPPVRRAPPHAAQTSD